MLKKLDKPLLFISIILFSIGLIMVFSASNVTAYMSHAVNPYHYFFRQLFFIATGIMLGLAIICLPTKWDGRISRVGMLAVIALLIVVFVVSEAKNQAKSWLDFGFVSLQPSEFAKIITIIWLSHYYDKVAKEKSKKDKKVKKEKKDPIIEDYKRTIYSLAVSFIPFVLILFQPDLGTAIIYALVVAIMYFSAPLEKAVKQRFFFVGVGAIMILTVLFVSGIDIINERQKERFDFFRPCDKLLDTGSQVCNGYIAINNGGLTGVGLGNSTQKYLYLPEPYTDFIFAIIVEELGAIAGIGIIVLYMFLLYRILLIGRNSYTTRGALICYGVAAYIFIHILVNLGGMFGLFILTGVPLPFMSYGGSFTWCLIAALSLVQRVNIETKLEEAGEAKCQS